MLMKISCALLNRNYLHESKNLEVKKIMFFCLSYVVSTWFSHQLIVFCLAHILKVSDMPVHVVIDGR